MESNIHLVDPLCSFLSSSYWLFRYTAFRMLNPEELHSSGSIHLGNELWIEMVCDWSILSSSLINGNTASLLGYIGQRSNFKISVVLHVSFSTNGQHKIGLITTRVSNLFVLWSLITQHSLTMYIHTQNSALQYETPIIKDMGMNAIH